MGDGVLAFFHQVPGGNAKEACRNALAAARRGLAALAERNRRQPPGAPVLHAGFALHYGTVSYGNIGSGNRLDFTVIGPDVNLTSRIERLCRELDRHLILSEASPRRSAGRCGDWARLACGALRDCSAWSDRPPKRHT